MRSVWRVGAYPEEVWVVPSFGATIPEGAHLVMPDDAAWSVDRWFSGDGASRLALAELFDAIGHPSSIRPDVVAPPVREAVRRAFVAGVLRAYRMPEKLVGSAVDEGPEQPSEPA